MSAAPLPAGNTHGYPPDGALVDGDRRVERRASGGSGDSPTDMLRRLPALVALERLPVPSIAVTGDGIILFANTAFAQMVGYEQEGLAGSAFSEMFHTASDGVAALSGAEAVANLVMDLRHGEGWVVRVRMSKSAMMRRDDPVVLVTFDNLTEQLWGDPQ
jgi:PAS domain S-box-containing protein